MRILVVSDSHGAVSNIERVLSKENFDMLLHLGDYFRDVKQLDIKYPDLRIECVYGNCDYVVGGVPSEKIIDVEGKKIFMTHGHTYAVKNSMDKLICKAKETSSDILLFGHTHVSSVVEGNGFIIINPGSISYSRDNFGESYAVIDIEKGKILWDICLI